MQDVNAHHLDGEDSSINEVPAVHFDSFKLAFSFKISSQCLLTLHTMHVERSSRAIASLLLCLSKYDTSFLLQLWWPEMDIAVFHREGQLV